ncbi:MAG: hypothetical protein R3F15_18030 [Lysobacterales bacterium]
MSRLFEANDYFVDTQGNRHALSAMRWDERHRRSRRVLPERASCWDYAALIDVMSPGSGPAAVRFRGMTALSWLMQLQNAGSPDLPAASSWVQAQVELWRAYCDKRPRVPDAYFGVELSAPRMVSLLAAAVRATGLKRAGVAQWRRTVLGLAAKGIKAEELAFSGLLEGLEQYDDEQVLAVDRVLELIDVDNLQPRLVAESAHGYLSRSGWKECCERIAPPYLRALGTRRRAQNRVAIRRALIRYRHRTFGWRLIREAWLPDLVSAERHLWYVADECGRYLHDAKSAPYTSLAEAMAAAEDAMRKHFRTWYRAHPVEHWSAYVAGGGEQYRELLVQLDDWPSDYRARHFRTRNVLAHVRTSVRESCDGQRLLYLDEVQSDWHADLVAQARGEWPKNERPVHAAPFAKEWPLLVLKLMLWRAQAMGVDALAWSTFEMQKRIWGPSRVPEALYKRTLPEAAKSLSKALGLELREIPIPFHAWRYGIKSSARGWLVIDLLGNPVTRPFAGRQQAERFAELIAEKIERKVPALMLAGLPRIRQIPFYGVGRLVDWTRPG